MIQLLQVSKSWDGGDSFAVRDVTLEVAQGRVLALLGGSGSGKSTTIKMINRLIEPTSGSIYIAGQDIRRRDPVELRRSIGYVFQAVGLFPHMTVAKNIEVVIRLRGGPATPDRKRVNELLELVHLPPDEFADRLPRQLSGGQRQRVGFARALATESQVMLLDEPFGALDPVTRDSLQVEFQQLQKALGFTAVLVTHDMAEALLLADVIAVMRGGQVIRQGRPAELLAEPGDEYVATLLETPKRHGELIRRLAFGGERGGEQNSKG
jgi:osmoprotectant transport system ATP-binding protein